MGYTHYFHLTYTDPGYRKIWRGLLADTRLIIQTVRADGVVVAGPDGYGRPALDLGRGIAFNGEAGSDLAGDTFALPAPDRPDPGLLAEWTTRFCKTGRKPYDLAVTAVLLRCALLAPDAITLASDGDWDDQWRTGPLLPGSNRRLPGARLLLAGLFGGVPEASPLRPLPPGSWPGDVAGS